MELLRGEPDNGRFALTTKKNVLVDEHRVQVRKGEGTTVADLPDFLPPADDAGEEHHRLPEITIHVAGVLSQGRSNDGRAARDVTNQPSEVGVGFEECPRDVDDAVEGIDRRKITLGRDLELAHKLGSSSRQRLSQQVLLVLEEQIDRCRGES